MSLCTKTTFALAALVLTAVPAWARHSWQDTANLCAAGQQKACRDLLKHVGDSKNCQRAIDELTDQAILVKVAQEDEDNFCGSYAVGKLTDQSLLTKLAVEGKDYSIRYAAVGKLTDQSLLAKFAVEDKDSGVRCSAVRKLTDQSLLAKIAVKDEEANVRKAAVSKLTDQSVLARVAEGDANWEVRRAAVHGLTDQTVLTRIRLNDLRMRGNLSKLRTGMLLSEAEKLIGPFPPPHLNGQSITSDTFGHVNITFSGYIETDLYVLWFEKNALTHWELK